jgi:hypothetical protein
MPHMKKSMPIPRHKLNFFTMLFSLWQALIRRAAPNPPRDQARALDAIAP